MAVVDRAPADPHPGIDSAPPLIYHDTSASPSVNAQLEQSREEQQQALGQPPGKRRRIGLKRSRLGCLQCRQRRKKCQGEKPTCKSCTDRHWVCVYPSNILPTTSPAAVALRRPPAVRPIAPAISLTPRATFSAAVFVNELKSPPASSTADSTAACSDDECSSDSSAFENDGVVYPKAVVATSTMPVPSISSFSSAVAVPSHEPNGSTLTATTAEAQWSEEVSSLLTLVPVDGLDAFDPFSVLNYSRDKNELLYYFTSTIASVIAYTKREPPFRRLILSLLLPRGSDRTSMTDLLVSALCALASAHRSYVLGVERDKKDLTYHTDALEQLVSLIETLPTTLEDETTQNMLLLSILILVYYEIVQGGYIDSIIIHLNDAYRIITAFLNYVIIRLQSLTGKGFRVSKETLFLFRVFQYFDVICSLSQKDKLVDSSLQLHRFLATYSRIRQSFGATSSNDALSDDGLDPLLGLAETLWPLIVRLCILCNDSNFGSAMTPDLTCRASLLELEIASWDVPEEATHSATPQDLAMQAAAKVYQLAAQIFMLRTFYPPESVAHAIQIHVRAALDQLARVCTLEGIMAGLLWPVGVIASECVDSIDRGFVKVVFMKLAKKQGMANVMRGLQQMEAGWHGLREDVVMMG
ncbi:fungal-specific transcription factor domain-containing protein [Limtongia smithiae]|uniref:fungal-specific transcription factor domain-containing protein n=1 Tax=Limtongia smithiae TaxID=1125753 RepID=UPI0034CEF4EC